MYKIIKIQLSYIYFTRGTDSISPGNETHVPSKFMGYIKTSFEISLSIVTLFYQFFISKS